MNDYPFDEVAAAAEKLANAGHKIHQKFTCAGCGQRLTIEEPNVFYTEGTCDQCPAVTNIREQGCNYLIYMRL
jgi:hypothetical protein